MILDRISRHTGQTLSHQHLPDSSPRLPASFNHAVKVAGMFSKAKAYLHVDYKPGERRLVQKIDFFILTFCCLSYLVNYACCPPFPDWSRVLILG